MEMELECMRVGCRSHGKRDRGSVPGRIPGDHGTNSGFDNGMNTIRKNLSREVEKGKRTQADMDAVMARIKPTLI